MTRIYGKKDIYIAESKPMLSDLPDAGILHLGVDAGSISYPVMLLDREMLKPWETGTGPVETSTKHRTGDAEEELPGND